jgi:streptogramin lyase
MNDKRTIAGAMLLVAAVCAVTTGASAAEEGHPIGAVVGTDGDPVSGALVTLTHLDKRRSTTVYSVADGSFRFPVLEAGSYRLRVRRYGFEEVSDPDLSLRGGANELKVELKAQTDPNELAWQLPASSWLPLLLRELSSDEHREEFMRQCTFCHQQGNWATRVPRSQEDWEKIFKLMARMGGVISADLRAELPQAFNDAYDETNYLRAFAAGETSLPLPQEAMAQAVVTEWDVGHPASMQHDLTVHPDGGIFSVDTNHDKLYRLDPATDERRVWDIPRGDSPLGGVFGAAGTLVAPNTDPHVAPHSLQIAPDGSVWITLCLGNKIARFDPQTEEWRILVQEEGLYPHTLRFDERGRVWYTLAVSNHIGMIDPANGERRTIRLPARTWGQAIALRLLPAVLWAGQYFDLAETAGQGEGVDLPVPYGIDIAPDGGVWFSQLNVHRIGRIDPDSGAIELIDTPFPGPRRLRFDSQGNLWIPGFSAGLVARFSLRTRKFDTWELPIAGVDTPYALNVDRKTDTIWICGTNSDTLISFDPRTEKFTVYPLPTRVTYTREIDFDAVGGVWTSNSNFPSWHIEGSGPKLIRLQPAVGSSAPVEARR